jgi:hypothetical protein
MTARWLNTIGLLLGMTGVVILFIWGPPPSFDEGDYLLLANQDAAHVEQVRRLKRQHEIMSDIGLGLIGLGFGAQLVAVWR